MCTSNIGTVSNTQSYSNAFSVHGTQWKAIQSEGKYLYSILFHIIFLQINPHSNDYVFGKYFCIRFCTCVHFNGIIIQNDVLSLPCEQFVHLSDLFYTRACSAASVFFAI